MTLKIEDSVLVIVDVQGKLATLMQQPQQLSRSIQILIKAAKLFDIPVLWLEQLPDKLGDTIEPIRHTMAEQFPTAQPIIKHSFSAMANNEFSQQLSQLKRQQVIVAGIESHICVYQTASALLNDSYQVFAVTDAISARTSENRQLGLNRMASEGAVLTSVEMTLFELQQVANTPRFKAVVKLIS